MKDIWDESMDVDPSFEKFEGYEEFEADFLIPVKDVPHTMSIHYKKIKEEYKEYPKQKYLDEFLSLKCAGDVLNVVNPIGKNAEKEISESMAIIKRLKPMVLKHPMKYNIIDLCAGNAITSVLAVHLLPIKYAIAVDKLGRDRQWDKVQRFEYVRLDITKPNFVYDCTLEQLEFKNTIIISSHPCKLARKVCEIYNNYNAHGLILIPCCEGALKRKYPEFVSKKLGRYGTWCWDLCQDVQGRMLKDMKCISTKNIVITAERE